MSRQIHPASITQMPSLGNYSFRRVKALRTGLGWRVYIMEDGEEQGSPLPESVAVQLFPGWASLGLPYDD